MLAGLLVGLAACGGGGAGGGDGERAPGEPGAPGAPGEPAEVLFLGGTLLTLDDPPRAEAMVVRGERIVELGPAEALAERYPRARRVDLEGRTLLPGFVDSHVHAHELGRDQLLADVTGTESVAEMVERLREHDGGGSSGWLVGQGWDEGEWGSRGYPDRAELDAAFPDRPVWLASLHGFAGLANGRALELAGIDVAGSGAAGSGAFTPDPEGGTILRRPDGTPTGVLLTLAQDLVRSQVPSDTAEQTRAAILAGLDLLADAGITSVHEAGVSRPVLDAYIDLARAGRLPIRVQALLDGNDPELVDDWIDRGPARAGDELDPSGFLGVPGFKVFYDGSLGSRTALLAEPYADDPAAARPTERISVERVRRLAEGSVETGLQLAVHAIGDEGNRRILDVFEEAFAGRPDLDARWRLEHAQVVTPGFYQRAARLGVLASMQPSHAVGDSGWAEARLGGERVRHAYAWRRMLDAGVPLVFNSDLPGEPWTPMETLYFATTRRRLPGSEGAERPAWYADQAVEVGEALHAMTVMGAYAAFDEDRLGRLAPGLLADLVELDADPTRMEPSELAGIGVGRVWVGGRLIRDPVATR